MIQMLTKVRIRAVVVQRTMIGLGIAATLTILADVHMVATVLKVTVVSAPEENPVADEALAKRHRF